MDPCPLSPSSLSHRSLFSDDPKGPEFHSWILPPEPHPSSAEEAIAVSSAEPPFDDYYQRLFERNDQWVATHLAKDPLYFTKLQQQQTPRIFWIGCSDSRVSPDILLSAKPGEIFTYRNVANMCLYTDMALLATLDYAVSYLKVDHIIVCGHYMCGGIAAAMRTPKYGLVDNWIRHIKDVYRFHFRELDKLPTEEARFRRFVELNVHNQVLHLAKTSVVQQAWNSGAKLSISGWVFNIHTGLIIDLDCTVTCNATLPRAYEVSSELIDWRFSQTVADSQGITAPEPASSSETSEKP